MINASRPSRVDVVDRLQSAIRRRRDLRPGSRAHWSNECEIRVLQRMLSEIDEAIVEAGRLATV